VDVYGYEDTLDPVLPTITPPRADRWLEEGLSVEGPPLRMIRSGGIRHRRPLRRVSCPNWHCTSWLTLAEFRQALDHHGLLPGLKADIHALLAAMQALEEQLGAGRTRLVYWFDNVPG
jgi:hypothetical protein